MKILCFNHVRFRNDWELDFLVGKFQIRIGRSQIALWTNYRPIVNWVRKPKYAIREADCGL